MVTTMAEFSEHAIQVLKRHSSESVNKYKEMYVYQCRQSDKQTEFYDEFVKSLIQDIRIYRSEIDRLTIELQLEKQDQQNVIELKTEEV